MVKILIKRGNDAVFLYESHIDTPMENIYKDVITIHNAIVKITDVCYEFGQLAAHGPVMPVKMQGLVPGQAEELGLKDEFAEQLDDDWVVNPDPLGRRCGRKPPENLQKVLLNTAEEAKQFINKANAEAGIPLTVAAICESLHSLRGAVLVLLPGGLPEHDPAAIALHECNDPSSIAVTHQDMLGPDSVLWFCGRQLGRAGKLGAALSTNNDKTKVTIKVTGCGQGPPAREPALSEQEQLKLLAHYRRKQEELEVSTKM